MLNKLQRGGIHAVPQVGGFGAVIKKMSEVRFAFRAGNGGADHVQTAVARGTHIFLRNRSPETRPTGPGIILRIRTEKSVVAADATIETPVVDVILPAEGSFGARFAGDFELQRRQLLLPLGFGLSDPVDPCGTELLTSVTELNDGDGIFVLVGFRLAQDRVSEPFNQTYSGDGHDGIAEKLPAIQHRFLQSLAPTRT